MNITIKNIKNRIICGEIVLSFNKELIIEYFNHTNIMVSNIQKDLLSKNLIRINNKNNSIKIKFEQFCDEYNNDFLFLDPIIIKNIKNYKIVINKHSFKTKDIFIINGIIKRDNFILNNNFYVFINYKFINKDNNLILFYNNELYIKNFDLYNKLHWITNKIIKFCSLYLKNLFITKKLQFLIVSDFYNEFLCKGKNLLILNFNYFPVAELDFLNFKIQIRKLIKIILFLIFKNNDFNTNNDLFFGFLNFLCFYIEYFCFEEKNEILSKIFNDYSNEINHTTYTFLFILNHIFKTEFDIFNNVYLNSLKLFICDKNFELKNIIYNLHKLYNFNFDNLFNMSSGFLKNGFPVFKIKVEERIDEHIFYLKLTFEQLYKKWFNGKIECFIHERIFTNKVYYNFDATDVKIFYYNCKGRSFKLQKNRAVRKTKSPKRNFEFIEVNPYGKLPCHIILDEENHFTFKKINSNICTLWTRLFSINSINTVNILKISSLLKNIFKEKKNTEFILIYNLFKKIFNNSLDKKIIYRFSKNLDFYTIPNYLNLVIGIYKYLFKDKNNNYIPVSVSITELYSSGLYYLRKELLLIISKYNLDKINKKVIYFFKEVIFDFKFKNIILVDFFLNLVKCIFNFRNGMLSVFFNKFILYGYNKYIKNNKRNNFMEEFLYLVNEAYKNKIICYNKNYFI